MTDIQWRDVKDNLCVMCKISLQTPSYYICNKCKKVCDVVHSEITSQLTDVKSVCCTSDIEMNQKITCGNYCHEKFILKMILEYGMFKKVIDQNTNIAYKIPTRTIIENGLRVADLKNYPIWA